jgi:hypothetical protein
MKKLLIAMLAVLALVAFTACNSTPAKAEPAKTEPAKAEPAKVEPAKAADPNVTMFEDFEGDFLWAAVGTSWNDGDSSIGAYASDQNVSQGKQSMEMVFKSTGKNQARFNIDKPDMSDWTGFTAIKLDIYNDTAIKLPFNVCVCTGDAWYWQETLGVELAPGWNKDVTLSFTNGIKNAATNWANTGTAIVDLNKIMRVSMSVNIATIDVSGKAYVDNIRLVK